MSRYGTFIKEKFNKEKNIRKENCDVLKINYFIYNIFFVGFVLYIKASIQFISTNDLHKVWYKKRNKGANK